MFGGVRVRPGERKVATGVSASLCRTKSFYICHPFSILISWRMIPCSNLPWWGVIQVVPLLPPPVTMINRSTIPHQVYLRDDPVQHTAAALSSGVSPS
jgi:hypothetical protein